MEDGNKNTPKTLVLLDAHAIIHRAYHALPNFSSSKGEPTGALYGLSNMLMKIISDLKPDYIIACYDLPEKTFRHNAYDGYKAKRIKTEEALVLQLDKSRKIFEAFNIPIYDAPGFEADDILGTIVEKFKNNKSVKIIIASGDMDTLQLVNGNKVQVYTLKKGINDTILYNEKKVIERFGFKPKFMADYKGLKGDPSDNIIGIKGIGEKIATNLIVNFGTIEEIYKKIKKDPKILESIGIKGKTLELIINNEEEALFSKTLAKIRSDVPINFFLPEKTFWQKADLLKIENIFSDFEFRSLVSRVRNFFGKNGAENLTQESKMNSIFDGIKEKISSQELIETSIALWLINPDVSNPTLEDILFFTKTKDFKEAKKIIFNKLEKEKLLKVYEEIEKPIINIVKKMGERGVLIDQEYFNKLSEDYHRKLDKLKKNIYKMAGVEFNINSPKQLSDILFEKLKIKSSKKRKPNGVFSTNIEVLEELEEGNPIIREIIAYRELQKLLSTYIDVIPKMVGKDNKLHAKFIQNGTSTGRFSSSDPNLQNLPIKTELGKNIRNGFIASEGHKLCAFDYSQIELRVAAILSGDKKMTRIFREKKDIHANVASFVFGVSIKNVTSEMRRKAKVINFGIIYGMGVSALKKNLGGTKEEAQKFYNNYFEQFKGVKKYLEQIKVFVNKNKYTETLFGRKRYFTKINSKILFLKNMTERTATNAPIQGTAADIIKLAIRYIEEDLLKKGLRKKTHLVLQIHDELVYEVEEDVLEEASKIIKYAMENVLERSFLKFKTDIPLLVHSRIGNNLGELK